ncbi:MAG: von Willebrand factor type A domain-containing protein [Pseudomonadota bacterium]
MTDPIDDLREAMKSAPKTQGKEAAMAAAMRAFDDEFSDAVQETRSPARQTIQMQPIWSRLMAYLTDNLRPALMGGASVAALSLAAFVVVQQNGMELPPAPMIEDAEIAAAPEAEIAVAAQKRMRLDALTSEGRQGPEASSRALAPMAMGGAASDLAVMPLPAPEPVYLERDARDRFANDDPNPVKLAAEAPVSTFSIDVDTASYAWVRRSLREGRMPAPEAVRVEELINYFLYEYARPETVETPFAVSTTVMDAPWAEGRRLLHIGIRGFEPEERPRANFTFLIDTSGSMQSADKLPLLLTSFRLLLDSLGPEDTVAIVTYAGSSGVALEPTAVSEKGKILDALSGLIAGGSTAGAAGIETAYRLAEDRFDADAVNRVILATDGDFNIGASSVEAMERLIETKRESGVYLSVLGFGRGNLNDALMQSLAQAGNGQAAYIDTLAEARKALVDEVRTLTPIAEDVKIQIEFNPAVVSDYRLIGYETRALNREDFNNDKVDAGEIGAGHRVTAIYEITPVGGPARIDDLRYQPTAVGGDADELAFLRIRHKAPGSDASELSETVVAPDAADAGVEARFAVAVAGFGELLRGSDHLGDWSWDQALTLAEGAKGDDPFGYRAEFLDLIRLARSLDR